MPGTRPQLGQPGAENTLRIASLRRFSNQQQASQRANSRGAFPGPFISPAAGYYDRARAQARQRDVRDISLSPDDNDGAREYFITALSHQPDFPAASRRCHWMPVQLENIAHSHGERASCIFASCATNMVGFSLFICKCERAQRREWSATLLRPERKPLERATARESAISHCISSS